MPLTSRRLRSPLADRPQSSAASAQKERPRAAGPGSSASTARPLPSCGSIAGSKPKSGRRPDRLERQWRPGFRQPVGRTALPDTVTALMTKPIRAYNNADPRAAAGQGRRSRRSGPARYEPGCPARSAPGSDRGPVSAGDEAPYTTTGNIRPDTIGAGSIQNAVLSENNNSVSQEGWRSWIRFLAT